MKECRQIRELMSAALDGELSLRERARLDAHLEGCPRCRAALAELRETVKLVKEVEPVEPPPWLTAKVMARLGSETAPRPSLWQRFFLPLQVKLPLQAVALVALCVTGYYLAKTNAPQVEFSAPTSTDRQEERIPAPTAPSPVPQAKPTPTPAPADSRSLTAPPRKSAPPPEAPPAPAPVREFTQPPPSAAPTPAAPSPAPQAPPPAESATPRLFSQDAGSLAPKKAAKAPHMREVAPLSPIKRETMRAADSIIRGTAAPAPPAAIRLTVSDTTSAGQSIADRLQTLGATVTTRQERAITARLDAARLAELLESLARLGTLKDKPTLPADANGPISVTISW